MNVFFSRYCFFQSLIYYATGGERMVLFFADTKLCATVTSLKLYCRGGLMRRREGEGKGGKERGVGRALAVRRGVGTFASLAPFVSFYSTYLTLFVYMFPWKIGLWSPSVPRDVVL